MLNKRLIPLKILFSLMCLFMVYLAVKTSFQSNLLEVLPQLNAQPWFTTTMVDFYFNITIISSWVIYKEKNLLIALMWVIGFICLGSIATLFYVLIQLWQLKELEPFCKILLRNEQ